MHMMRLWISLLFFLLSLTSIHANDEYIQSQIYTKFPGAKACFRLMHRKGQIGCSTPPSGLIGTLRLLTSQAAFDAMIAKPPAHQVAAVITQEQFSQKNVQRLKDSVRLAGILILKSSPPATGFSPEVHNPPAYFDTPSITLPENDANIFKWNPLGDGMSYQEFPFGIVQVQDDHSTLLQQRAQWNEDKIRDNEHPAQTIQFNYRMYGEKDSYTCLADSRCIPVGGYSVWSPFGGRLNTSIPRPIVMAIAPMDSSAFFHEMAYGGDSTASGLAALLGAAAAIGSVQNVSLLNSSIIFAAFNAETWSQSGSRKFVQDLQSFRCRNFAGANSCYQPYQTSLDFTKFNVTNITRIIELNQIGLNTTVFMHRDKTLNAETEALMRDLVNTTINMTNAGITDFRIAPTAGDLGLPPSSSQAFIAANPSIGTVVLTDHEREYANKYYHSRFDDVTNVQNKLRYYPHLCNVATLTARTLYLSAGGNTTMAQTIKADCEMVSKLYLCLVEDMKCDFVKQFTSSGGGKNPSKYSGVYQLQQRRFIGGIPRFVYEFLGAYSQNTTADQQFGYAWFHDAVDPAFVFDYDRGMWNVNETVGKPSMLWTESNWDTDVGIRLFMTESPAMETGMILAGIGIFLLTAGFLWRSKKWCAFHYKAI